MKYFIILGALWSGHFASAIPHSPFTLVSSSQKESCEKEEIPNMPKVRSQDSLPICDSISSATVLQYQVCRINKVPDCSSVSKNLEVSPLSTVAWTRTNRGSGVHELQNHQNLQFYSKVGSAYTALSNSSKEFIFASDGCYPFDQLANTLGEGNDDRVRAAVERVEEVYTRATTEAGFCEDCLKQPVQELGIKSSLSEIKQTLEASKKAKETSGEFLYSLLMGSCKDFVSVRPSKKPKFDSFPSAPSNYAGMMSKIKDVLRTKNPLTFDGVCLQFEGKKCVMGHSVVISGYRKLCKKNGKCETECREVLKVQNSWGEDWQKQNDDGWVDAKSLLSYVTDNPDLMTNSLAWYQ